MKRLFLICLVLSLSFSIALAEEWVCPNCGKSNTTNFCTSCGTKHDVWICMNCGAENSDSFCGNCGAAKPADTSSLFSDVFLLTMDGSSMADTLNDEDLVLFGIPALKDNSAFKRLDIVACNYPERGETMFIKRLVGLPGDTVELRDGYLYINGVKYEEPYINDEYRSGRMNTFGPYTVPEGMYFVMGDHRNNSNDSRSVGPLNSDMITGVAISVNGVQVKNEYSESGLGME